jgi:hypothetical protein
MKNISQKKMMHDRNKKSVRTGLKIRLPTGERIESGSPHAIKIGREKSVIKS